VERYPGFVERGGATARRGCEPVRALERSAQFGVAIETENGALGHRPSVSRRSTRRDRQGRRTEREHDRPSRPIEHGRSTARPTVPRQPRAQAASAPEGCCRRAASASTATHPARRSIPPPDLTGCARRTRRGSMAPTRAWSAASDRRRHALVIARSRPSVSGRPPARWRAPTARAGRIPVSSCRSAAVLALFATSGRRADREPPPLGDGLPSALIECRRPALAARTTPGSTRRRTSPNMAWMRGVTGLQHVSGRQPDQLLCLLGLAWPPEREKTQGRVELIADRHNRGVNRRDTTDCRMRSPRRDRG
jgi:hypothetical protein